MEKEDFKSLNSELAQTLKMCGDIDLLRLDELSLDEYIKMVESVCKVGMMVKRLRSEDVLHMKKNHKDYLCLQNNVKILQHMAKEYNEYLKGLAEPIFGVAEDGCFGMAVKYSLEIHHIGTWWKKCSEREGDDDIDKALENVYGSMHTLTDIEFRVRNLLTEPLMAGLKIVSNYISSYDKVDAEYADVIAECYYSYAERNEDGLEGEIIKQLYELGIVSYVCDDEIQPRDYGALLKLRLSETSRDTKFSIINKVNDYRRMMDIRDPRIIEHLYHRCKLPADLEMFFHYFAEINLLKGLSKPSIRKPIRPITEKEVVVLPTDIAEWIRNDADVSIEFKNALDKVVAKMGANFKTKWAHLQKMMEDEAMVDVLIPAAFGRMIQDIYPDIKAQNVAASITRDASLNLNDNDKDKRYDQLPITHPVRTICSKCRDDFFKGIIAKRPQ